MKKLLIIISVFILCGCSNNFNNLNKDTIINDVISIAKNISASPNTTGKGFKYYKPRDFALLEDNDYNHVLIHNSNKYYLSIDVNAYFTKTINEYIKKKDYYYSTDFKYNDKVGFLEIKEDNSYFYVKMLYNYSYVEVCVNEYELKDAIIDSAILLSSIEYNDTIINNLITVGDLDSRETPYEIKKPKDNSNRNILDVYEYDKYN